MLKKCVSGALAVLLAMSTAHAAAGVAQLSQVQGKVLVNHGEGFVPANGMVELLPGDKIMVGTESSATLSYFGADCTISIAPSSVVTVNDVAPCKAGETVGAVDSLIVTPTQDGGEGGAIVPLFVGGFIIAAVVIAIIAATDGGGHGGGAGPVSPN